MGRNNSKIRQDRRRQAAELRQNRSIQPGSGQRLLKDPCHLTLGECRLHRIDTPVRGRPIQVIGRWKDYEGNRTGQIEVGASTFEEAQGYFAILQECDYAADLNIEDLANAS